MTRHRITLAAACICSALGVAMSITAAAHRSGPGVTGVLVVASAAVITLAAYLLPALLRGWPARVVYGLCMLVVTYQHMTLISVAAHGAGDERAAAVQTSAAAQALQQQLDGLAARPAATVAAALAGADGRAAAADQAAAACEHRTPGQCRRLHASQASAAAAIGALRIELDSARQADTLRAQLAHAGSDLDQRRAAAATDPAAAALAAITGLPATQTATALQLLQALLIEIIATLLWAATLRREESHADITATPTTTTRLRMQRADPRAAAARRPHSDRGTDPARPALHGRLARALAHAGARLRALPGPAPDPADRHRPHDRQPAVQAAAPRRRGHRARRTPADTS